MKAEVAARAWRGNLVRVAAALLMLAAALAATEGRAQKGRALSGDDLLGRWCGATTDYVFTRKNLTVTFHDDKSKRVMPITDIVFRDDGWLNVMWGKDSGTGFEFENGKLIQRPNTSGDMGPRRVFRKC